MRDLRTLVIGLLLGVCVALSVGQAPPAREAAPAAAAAAAARTGPAPVYQFTALPRPNGSVDLIILDHRTQMLYPRTIAADDLKWPGVSIEELLGNR